MKCSTFQEETIFKGMILGLIIINIKFLIEYRIITFFPARRKKRLPSLNIPRDTPGLRG